jgi:hypothetical protein
VIGNYRFGFRAGRSNSDKIHALRQIKKQQTSASVHSIHFSKAMGVFGIPAKLVRLARVTLETLRGEEVQNDISEPVETQAGLREGHALRSSSTRTVPCPFSGGLYQHVCCCRGQ